MKYFLNLGGVSKVNKNTKERTTGTEKAET